MEPLFVLKAIGCMAVVTFLLRALPFIGAAHLSRFPRLLQLGRFLPPAIMALLLLHSVMGSAAEHDMGLWPALLAAFVAMALQWHMRQPLVSILAATGLYVALVNGIRTYASTSASVVLALGDCGVLCFFA